MNKESKVAIIKILLLSYFQVAPSTRLVRYEKDSLYTCPGVPSAFSCNSFTSYLVIGDITYGLMYPVYIYTIHNLGITTAHPWELINKGLLFPILHSVRSSYSAFLGNPLIR